MTKLKERLTQSMSKLETSLTALIVELNGPIQCRPSKVVLDGRVRPELVPQHPDHVLLSKDSCPVERRPPILLSLIVHPHSTLLQKVSNNGTVAIRAAQ